MMESVEAARFIAKGLAALSLFGTAIGQGYLFGKAFEAMGRNPDMSSELSSRMLIGAVMAETTAIYAVALAWFIF